MRRWHSMQEATACKMHAAYRAPRTHAPDLRLAERNTVSACTCALQYRSQQAGCLSGNTHVARAHWAESSRSTRSGFNRAPQRPEGPGTAGSAGRAAPPPASCPCKHSARMAECRCLRSPPREQASPRPLPAENADWTLARLQHRQLARPQRAPSLPETRRGRAPRSPRRPLSGWRRGCPQPSRQPAHRCQHGQRSPTLPGP